MVEPSPGALRRQTCLIPTCATCKVSLSLALPPGTSLSLSIPRRDQKALSYFYHFAAVDLSGYLPGRYWDKLVLQISDAEPVVQQTVVAVGNAHLDHCEKGIASSNTLSSHQKALYKLRKYVEYSPRTSHEIVIVCCILLFAFARMIQDQRAADVHLESAISILRNARGRAGNEPTRHRSARQGALHSLSVWLMQLDIEATMQDVRRRPQLNLDNDVVGGTFTEGNWTFPLRLSSPHEAMEPWMAVAHDLWRFITQNARYRYLPIQDVPTQVVTVRTSLQHRLRDWRRMTRDYVRHSSVIAGLELGHLSRSTHRTREIVDVINALIIEAHYFASKRFLAESLQDPPGFKPFDWKPEKLLKVAQRVVSLRKVYHDWTNVQPNATFSTHAGIVEALLLLVHRTSLPCIRSQAQSLVQQLIEAQGGLTGIAAFHAGYGAPPRDLVLIFEKPGH